MTDRNILDWEAMLDPGSKEQILSGKELRDRLDSGNLSREQVAGIVRKRYEWSAARLDGWLQKAIEADDLPSVREVTALILAFNYVRGMNVLRHDGVIDRKEAPAMMVSPSASVQLLRYMNLTKDDTVLELFSGAGYLTFFLSLLGPKALYCIDLYAPRLYDLEKTYAEAVRTLSTGLPDEYKPDPTKPVFIEGDVSLLSVEAISDRIGAAFQKVVMHPPFGRESTVRDGKGELDCFHLWCNTLRGLSRSETPVGGVFSIIPLEWATALQFAASGSASKDETFSMLAELLSGNPFYTQGRLVPQGAQDINDTDWGDMMSVIKRYEVRHVIPLREANQFPMAICVLKRALVETRSGK